MNRFALLTLYRSLTRHRLYAALNIGGLAVGVAVFLVLSLYVRFETSYEKWLPAHGEIYVVQETWTLGNAPASTHEWTMGGLFEQLKADFPTLVGTRYMDTTVNVISNGTSTSDGAQLVDPTLFDVFDLPMEKGDGRRAIMDPSAVILGAETARKYFAGADPIGRNITIAIAGTPRVFHVAGVLKELPKETAMRWTFITRLVPTQLASPTWYQWGSGTLQTYLRFPDRGSADGLTDKLGFFAQRHGGRDLGSDVASVLHLSLKPITELRLDNPAKRLAVITLGLVGLLTLLIAVINYVNLATARAGLRAREVAMRKVLGASRGVLIRQFLSEAILTAMIASLLGLILAELALPLVNAAGGLSLDIPYGVAVPALVLLSILIGIAAGFYPAMVLAGFPAAAVLASARTPGGGRSGARLREALVVVQFALAIAFIIGTAVLFAQTSHVRKTDIGFRREGLIVVPSLRDETIAAPQRAALLAAFEKLPDVVSVAASDAAPGDEEQQSNARIYFPGADREKAPSIRWMRISPGWFATMDARLIAGRYLDQDHRIDDLALSAEGNQRNAIISRSAAAVLGFPDPGAAVGKPVSDGKRTITIVGVVDDMRLFSPRDPIPPTLYYMTTQPIASPVATIRYRGSDAAPLMDRLRLTWRQLAPQAPLEVKTAAQNLSPYYDEDDQSARLFAIGAGLAVLVGCVGLWGLASFNTARRVREIGIRKTLGASSGDIIKLLVGQFLRPVLISNLVAWPLAYVAMRSWLAGFDDRIALSLLYFLGASLAAVAIAMLTVIGQSLRASRAAPAWALRHD